MGKTDVRKGCGWQALAKDGQTLASRTDNVWCKCAYDVRINACGWRVGLVMSVIRRMWVCFGKFAKQMTEYGTDEVT